MDGQEKKSLSMRKNCNHPYKIMLKFSHNVDKKKVLP